MEWRFLLIPLASMLSCWLVVKLIIAILFRPSHPKSFVGFKIQGVLPAKQPFIAKQIGILVAEKFFSAKAIEEKIADPKHLQKIMPEIEAHIDDFLRNKLKKEMPFIGAFIGEKTIVSLKKVFMSELESLFPKIISRFSSNIVSDFNIGQMVTKKIGSISVNEVEGSFRRQFSKELRMTEAAAVFIGLFIGCIAMIIVILIK
ncbi:MAG TPA: hypothetical protein VGI82_14870 [Chitinophagaceae bacterium]